MPWVVKVLEKVFCRIRCTSDSELIELIESETLRVEDLRLSRAEWPISRWQGASDSFLARNEDHDE